MSTIARLRILLAAALGALGVGCVLFFFGMVTQVGADPPISWYVAPGGNDAPGCGATATPCRTIQYTIGQASVGTKIIITPGTFTESIQLNKAITLTGSGMGQTIIRTGSPGIIVAASQAVISGITLAGQGDDEGILVSGGTTAVSILNSEIYSYSAGIQLDGGSGHVLRGNMIRGNSIGLVATGAVSFVARNNTIRDNLTAGILLNGAGPIAATLSGASSYTNTFRNNGGTNLTVTLPSTNADINAYWNDWGANTIAGIESTIYHKPDNAALAKVDFYTLTIAAAPLTAAANGATRVNITGTLSGFFTPGAGDVISFTKNLGTLSAVTAATNPGGEASVVMISTVAGTATITATSGIAINHIRTATVKVNWTSGAAYTITLVANPPLPRVGYASTLNMTVTDRYGNIVAPGTQVTIEADWGGFYSPVTTDERGNAASSIASTQAGPDHITATSGTARTTTVVTFTPDVPKTVTLEANPTSQVVGNNSVLTATVRDQYGNAVTTGTPVTFTKDLGSLAPPVVATTGGIATARISSTLRGTATITAASGSAPPARTTIVFRAGAPYTLTLLAAPTLLVAGNNSVLTATVTDRYNNRVEPGTPVTFTASRGNVFSPVPTANGVATSLFSDTLVGTRAVTAASGSAPPDTRTIVFTVGPPYSISTQVNPPNLIANSGATSTITATVTDLYGNPIQGLTLSGQTSPPTLGSVSWLGATNANGQAFGIWTATKDSTAGSGLLQVSGGSAVGTAPIALKSGHLYLPVVMNKLRTELLQNGDFAQGLEGWTRNPDDKLSVSPSVDPAVPGDPAALLGSPAYPCSGVPVGYGSLSQSFIMPDSGQQLVLKFSYHIYTDDRNLTLDPGYDRFDVLINNTVVFTDMNRHLLFGCGNHYDLGRKEASVPVTGSAGARINLTFRLRNGGMIDPTWYNTYVHLDNVRLVFESQP